MATIKEIAALAGVSRGTVDRVLNHRGSVNPVTAEKITRIAKELDYNPKYLSALVKRQTGYSGQALIDQYSVLTAMAKLSYGHRSIKEISDEMNFQSQSDFGKFFKRMTGVSPINYRKDRFKGL